MKNHLFTILIGAASMVASYPVRAQSIVATHDALQRPGLLEQQGEALEGRSHGNV
jgi:hypothetical protein